MVRVLVRELRDEKRGLGSGVTCCGRLTLGFDVSLSWNEQARGVPPYLRHLLQVYVVYFFKFPIIPEHLLGVHE